MFRLARLLFGVVLVLAFVPAQADDLTGADNLVCAAMTVVACWEDGVCVEGLPEDLNVPQFIEIDLEAKLIQTTAASGENRVTPIEHLDSEEGMIALQGYEFGRGFTFVIDEKTGRATVAIATRGSAVIVFGSCTPMTTTADSGRK